MVNKWIQRALQARLSDLKLHEAHAAIHCPAQHDHVCQSLSLRWCSVQNVQP